MHERIEYGKIVALRCSVCLMKKVKRNQLLTIPLFLGLFFFLVTTSLYAAVPLCEEHEQFYNGECVPKSELQNPPPASFSNLEGIFENVLGIVVSLAALAVFIMFLKGGFNFLTSGGDPQKNASAKNAVTWAVIGLIVLLSIWFVFQLIAEITGVEGITTFEIPH